MKPTLFCGVCALVICAPGCATVPQGTHVIHSVFEPPEPAALRCGVVRAGAAHLEVRLLDVSGGGVEGAAVHITDGEYLRGVIEPPPTFRRYSDSHGRAVLEVPGGRTYTVIVVVPGFVPVTRVLHLKDTCAGITSIVLRVASTEDLQNLIEWPHR